jgi:hypothetical protein
MNIEQIVRTGFKLKMHLASTGYFSIIHKSGTFDLYAVDGDHQDIDLPINWGQNKVTIKARDPIYILQKDLFDADMEKAKIAEMELKKIPQMTDAILDTVYENQYKEGTVDTGHLKFNWIKLESDEVNNDKVSQSLAKMCVNLTVRNGEKHHVFFTYPINLSQEYLTQQKTNMYYE